jgi:hypothetical protein
MGGMNAFNLAPQCRTERGNNLWYSLLAVSGGYLEASMKRLWLALSIGLVTSLVATGLVTTQAAAQNYPWCSIYSGDMGGAKNCGFISFEQCMANVHGIGGFCQRNDWYRPPAGATGRVPTTTHY